MYFIITHLSLLYFFLSFFVIVGEDRQKLSKRHGAASVNQFKEDGFLPDAMINYLSLLGWNDGSDTEIFSREDLIDAFGK
jgi:glutamyl-tRNA synthetase